VLSREKSHVSIQGLRSVFTAEEIQPYKLQESTDHKFAVEAEAIQQRNGLVKMPKKHCCPIYFFQAKPFSLDGRTIDRSSHFYRQIQTRESWSSRFWRRHFALLVAGCRVNL
jgi:hypothetical protein